MSKKTDVVQLVDDAPTVAQQQQGQDVGRALLFDPVAFEQVSKVADMMAKGKATMPDHLVGNAGDCMAIAMQAVTWGMNPWAVASKTHLVHGTLGYEAQLVNAVITSMAPTVDRLHYEWYGEWSNILGKFQTKSGKNGDYTVPAWDTADETGLGVRVWATLKGEDSPRELDLLLAQAVVRNSTLWAQDPRQQLAYLASKRWARLYTPDVLLGVYTPDELQSGNFAPQPPKDITPRPQEIANTGSRSKDVLADLQQKDASDAQAAPGSAEDYGVRFEKATSKAEVDSIMQEVADIKGTIGGAKLALIRGYASTALAKFETPEPTDYLAAFRACTQAIEGAADVAALVALSTMIADVKSRAECDERDAGILDNAVLARESELGK